MATTNAITKKENKVSFSMKMNSDSFQRAIINALQDPGRAARFTAALTSAVANNPALQECDASTVLSAALLGECLNLSPSPQLGQYYLVPFEDRKNHRKAATFILGYKGMIQLAIRSGQYKDLGAAAVKEGELVNYNPITEEAVFSPITDDKKRAAAKTVGYYAWLELQNGFKKALYWSKERMQAHAEQYSMGYKARKGYTFWEKDFDSMAKKTMLRQLISKWGVMSIDFQNGYINDAAVVHQDGSGVFTPEAYPDDSAEAISAPPAAEETKEGPAPAEEPVVSPFGDEIEEMVDLSAL